jgi:hypothetical protein
LNLLKVYFRNVLVFLFFIGLINRRF